MELKYEGERQTADGAEKDILRIPITKASASTKDASWAEVCIDDLPADVYKEVLLQGLKTLLNRGMSKITDAKSDPKAREAAMEVAAKNVQNLYEGKIRMTAGVRAKGAASGAVKTEAMRLARLVIKAALKDAGKKVSLIKGSVITQYAQAYLDDENYGPDMWKKAEANVKAREAEKDGTLADLKGFTADIKEDATLVAKAEASAAKKRKPKKGEEAPAGVVAKRQAPPHLARH